MNNYNSLLKYMQGYYEGLFEYPTVASDIAQRLFDKKLRSMAIKQEFAVKQFLKGE